MIDSWFQKGGEEGGRDATPINFRSFDFFDSNSFVHVMFCPDFHVPFGTLIQTRPNPDCKIASNSGDA